MTFFEFLPSTTRDLWVLTQRDGNLQSEPFLATPSNERSPRFSPDGRWIVYVSNYSGRDEVFLKAYPGPGGQVPVSGGRGSEPVWSSDGREIFYRDGNRLIAVSVETSPSLSLGKPRVLFEEEYLRDAAYAPQYDVARDGQRFIMIAPTRPAAAGLFVVQNWFEELKRRFASGND
jgi:serine/threonine-protein kinase